MVNTHKDKTNRTKLMDEELIDEELKVKLYRNVERAVNILESVRATLVDKLGENAEDITDALQYIVKDLDHDVLEGIANLPTE